MPSWNSDAELNLGCEIGLRNLIGKSGQKQSGKQSKRNKRGGNNQCRQRKKANKAGRQTKKEDKQERRTKSRKKREKTKKVIRCFGFAFGFAPG